MTNAAEQILRGHGAARGVAHGPAFVVESGPVLVPEFCLPKDKISEELARLQTGIEKSIRQLKRLKQKMSQDDGADTEDVSLLLEAHMAMLSGSHLIRGITQRIEQERLNAEAAVQQEVSAMAQRFSDMQDAYLAARSEDVREVGARLIRNLMGHTQDIFSLAPKASILVAEEISPSAAALLDPERILGITALLGGAEGHTAIVSRAKGMPAVLGVAGLLGAVRPGTPLIIDGRDGLVIINPSLETKAAYVAIQEKIDAAKARRGRQRRLVSQTAEGTPVHLFANLEDPAEAPKALADGAEGIGLLRSEFLFMNRQDLPEEQEQYLAYRGLVKAMEGRPLTIRTLDLGGEKLASALGGLHAETPNPALGLRAIRLCLAEPKLLDAQLAALLRAGAHGPLRILIPMISSAAEILAVRERLKLVARKLVRKDIEIANPLPPLGAMIEIPAAALTADTLALKCDFFAIGSNDLTQYTLAIDRADEQVAALYDPLHPAVLRLMQFTVEAALRARIPVSLCGELAGDSRTTALLLGLGLRELSMSPGLIAGVKEQVRATSLERAQNFVRQLMEQSDPQHIRAQLAAFQE